MRSIVASILLLFISASLFADEDSYFMWVDDDGVLNFSQVAPREEVFEEISRPPQTRGEQEESQSEAIDNRKALPSAASSLPGDISSESIARINRDVRARNCASARRTLDKLAGFKQIIIRGDDGFWREVSDDVKQQEILRAAAAIAENCETL